MELKARDGLATEEIDDDLLILDKENEKIHQLNASAKAVWESLQQNLDTDEMVQQFVKTFDIAPDVATSDVTRILDQFRALKLVEARE